MGVINNFTTALLKIIHKSLWFYYSVMSILALYACSINLTGFWKPVKPPRAISGDTFNKLVL